MKDEEMLRGSPAEIIARNERLIDWMREHVVDPGAKSWLKAMDRSAERILCQKLEPEVWDSWLKVAETVQELRARSNKGE